MSFLVTLDSFYGPLDLLLHLVRKHELEATKLPVATVTQQYLEYVAVLEQLDVDSIGDFLEVASTLVELKSRLVLPRFDDEEPAEEAEGPKDDLVRRLLEFKKYRDAAAELEQQGAEWRRRFARVALEAPERGSAAEEQPIAQVELWDLVSAFGRVMQDRLEPPAAATIPYDDTPVHVFMRRVYDRLQNDGPTAFSNLFAVTVDQPTVHKSTLIATFLAVLELVRHGHALAEQSERYGDLLLRLGGKQLTDAAAGRVSVAAETDTA